MQERKGLAMKTFEFQTFANLLGENMKEFQVQTITALLNEYLRKAGLDYKFECVVTSTESGRECTLCLVEDVEHVKHEVIDEFNTEYIDIIINILWTNLNHIEKWITLLKIHEHFMTSEKSCVIDLGNMTMRFIHKIYKGGIHTIVHSNISCTELGVELVVEQQYPYVDITGGYKTIHPNEKCRKRAFSSDSAVVTADNYWTVYTILNQRIMNDLKSSDFWKSFKGNE